MLTCCVLSGACHTPLDPGDEPADAPEPMGNALDASTPDGGEPLAPPEVPDSLTPLQFCEAATRILCVDWAACCPGSESRACRTVEECLALFQQEAYDTGAMEFSPTGAANEIAVLQAAAARCDVSTYVASVGPSSGRGNLKAGDDCSFSTTDESMGFACGPGTKCYIGLPDELGNTPGICGPVAALGESCDDQGSCQDGLYCAWGVCEPMRRAGEACTSEFQCTSSNCDGVCQPDPFCL